MWGYYIRASLALPAGFVPLALLAVGGRVGGSTGMSFDSITWGEGRGVVVLDVLLSAGIVEGGVWEGVFVVCGGARVVLCLLLALITS